MDYQKIDMGAYNLHIINTTKFKTITVDICFRRPIKKEDISNRIILKDVLLNSNQNYKTETELIKESENLYDLKLMSSSSRIGTYTNLSFKTRFLNEKYTEEGMNEESIKFLLDIIFKPNITDKKFSEEVLSQVKERNQKNIKTLKDDKIRYAIFSLLEKFSDKPYSYNPYGDKDIIQNITPASLYEYYKSVINDDIVDVFIVGDVDVKNTKELFKEYFKVWSYHKKKDDIITPPLSERSRIKNYEELTKVNQSQIVLLYSIKNLSEYERKYVLLVYNELLGGSSSSVLFDNIREKNSYAYYVSSLAKAYDNLLIIYSGVEPSNEETVIKQIRKNVDAISKGKFAENYFENAKETIISGIIASTDNPYGIINTYFAKSLVGSASAEERIENIKKVSINDIITLSKKIKVHSSYALKGGPNGDKD